MISHAQTPFAQRIDGDLYRIYFSSRDSKNRSYVSWLDVDITRPDRIVHLCSSPLLSPGADGQFDDAGAMMSCIVTRNETNYFYYIGWSLRASSPYHLSIGLATGPRYGELPMKSGFPVLDRSAADPLFCTSPYVLIENGRWRMWYLSGVGWPSFADRVVPSYDLRYAESSDGISWHPTGRVVLPLQRHEVGFSRPSILPDGGGYIMWYSARGQDHRYLLHFASSADGLSWTRVDGGGLEPSDATWDSEMIAYPHVFDHGRERYMLYCGNEYGRGGFGLAVLSR